MFSPELSSDEWDVVHRAVWLACNFHPPSWGRYLIVKGTIQQKERKSSFYKPKKILFQLDNCHLRTNYRDRRFLWFVIRCNLLQVGRRAARPLPTEPYCTGNTGNGDGDRYAQKATPVFLSAENRAFSRWNGAFYLKIQRQNQDS